MTTGPRWDSGLHNDALNSYCKGMVCLVIPTLLSPFVPGVSRHLLVDVALGSIEGSRLVACPRVMESLMVHLGRGHGVQAAVSHHSFRHRNLHAVFKLATMTSTTTIIIMIIQAVTTLMTTSSCVVPRVGRLSVYGYSRQGEVNKHVAVSNSL